MKKVFITLTSIIILHANINPVFGQEVADCYSLEYSPEISFETSYGKLSYDYSKSKSEITKMADSHGVVEEGLFANGLSNVTVNWELSVDTISKILSDDQICIIPVKVNMFLGYSDPVIYVAKELEPDTCEYNVVLRHEEAHQQINKASLEYFVPKINLALHEVAKGVLPIEVTNLGGISNASTQISEEYIAYVKPLVESFKSSLLVEQDKLDSKENNKYENNLCLVE